MNDLIVFTYTLQYLLSWKSSTCISYVIWNKLSFKYFMLRSLGFLLVLGWKKDEWHWIEKRAWEVGPGGANHCREHEAMRTWRRHKGMKGSLPVSFMQREQTQWTLDWRASKLGMVTIWWGFHTGTYNEFPICFARKKSRQTYPRGLERVICHHTIRIRLEGPRNAICLTLQCTVSSFESFKNVKQPALHRSIHWAQKFFFLGH